MDTNAIKYCVKTILLIVVISFVVDKIVFLSLNKVSDKVYSGQTIGKLNLYLEKKDTLELIVFGSSRANHNINPIKISQNSFNMGMDGRMIAYSATLVKLLPRNKKQTIMFHIDPKNAFKKDYYGNDIQPLSSKYNRNKFIKEEIDKINQSNLLQNFYWSLSYNKIVLGTLKNYMRPKYNYVTYSGFDPLKVTNTQKKIFENILKKEDRIQQTKECQEKFALNKLYNEYIDELKMFCDENNKELIVFTSPIFNDKCKIDNNVFKRIMNKKEITYYDFTDFFKQNNLIEYWKDKTHLSDKGAEKFTEEIEELLKKK